MKLLFDQNLSPGLIKRIDDLYPESNHVFLLGLDSADDRAICEFAESNDFIVVTKDADYSDSYLLLGSPPKVIWIRRGNCSTSAIEEILRAHYEEIKILSEDSTIRVLTIF